MPFEILRSSKQLEASPFLQGNTEHSENVVSRSPVLHLLEFILEAVFYGKYLSIHRLCLGFSLVCLPVFLTVKESQLWSRANESFPLFLWEQGNDFQNVTLKISSKNSNKYT